MVTAVPILALGLVVWQVWGDFLRWSDVIVFAIMYLATGLGITVGFHRYFTHRSFKTSRPMRAILAVLGSVAIEGPIISWVADHRKHHTFADQEGDPHSPHVDHGVGWRGALRGLMHAHVGWLFIHTQRGLRRRYARDLIDDPIVNFVDRKFVFWAVGGLVASFAARLGDRRVALRRSYGAAVGRRGEAVRGPPRDLQHQLAVPLLRAQALRDRRRVAQPALAGAVLVWRELAQQPSRLPDLGRARHAPLGDRSLGAGDPRAREARPGVGRGPGGPRASGAPEAAARGGAPEALLPDGSAV